MISPNTQSHSSGRAPAEVIASGAPTASIAAVEPSRHLRTALLHRIASDTDLRPRVTIENLPFPASRLPASFDALVMTDTLGHLDRQAREHLWQVIAARPRPAGYVVINLHQPTTASTVPEFEMAHERVGNRSYHGSAWAECPDDTTMKWHVTCRTSEDGTEIDATDVDYLWNVIDYTALENELAQYNFSATAFGDDHLGTFRIAQKP